LKQREHAALTTRPAKVQVPTEILTEQWAETLAKNDQAIPEKPQATDPCGICEAARPDLSQTLAKAAIAYFEERCNGWRSAAAEKYIVENFMGQTSLANLRNALKEESVVVDDLTGLLMSQPAVMQELDSIEVMESGKEETKDSLRELNETIASNFAMHEQLMSWNRAEETRKANSLKDYAPNVETAQWLVEDVGMELDPIVTLFNLASDPEREVERVEIAEVSLEALETVGKGKDESSVEIEAAEPEEIIEVARVEPFYLEPMAGGLVEGLVDEAEKPSLETEAKTSPKDEDPTEDAKFIAEVTRVTVQYFNDKVKQGEGAAVDGDIGVVENSDYRVEYHHNEESGEPPRLIVEETTTNSSIFEIVRGVDQWEAEIVKFEATEWLVAADRELAEEFIAELTRVTVQYFGDKVKQGEGAAVDGDIGVVENSNYRVEYHHNEESGEPPRLMVQETTTNSLIFETVRGVDQWEAETVKPEAKAWLEEANRELVEHRIREPEIRKPQMEL